MKTFIKRYGLFGLLLLFVMISMTGCKDKTLSSQEYMAFDTILYMDSSPRQVALGQGKKCIDGNKLPIKDFKIVDSLMFLETNDSQGIIKVLSLKDLSPKGDFLNMGQSIGEFPIGVYMSQYGTFMTKNDSLYAVFCEQTTSRIYVWNVTSSLETGKTQIREMFPDADIASSPFWVKMLPDSTLLTKEFAGEETMQKRWLIKGKNKKSIPNMNFADDFAVPKGEDFNLLSTLPGISPDGTKCVEAMIGMNYINVYSLETGKGFSVCCGKEPDKMSDILAQSPKNRKYMFADVRTYDFGFAVLKYDITDEEFQSKKNFTPSILTFTWEGKTLGEIKPGIQFCGFDIDFINNTLFVLSDDGSLWQYKILE